MAERELPNRRGSLLAPVVLLIVSAVAACVILGTSWALGRAVFTAAIVSIGPGLALVPLARIQADLLLEAVLVLLVSLGVDICVAQAVTYGWGFTWRPCAAALVSVCVLGAVLQLGSLAIGRGEGRS